MDRCGIAFRLCPQSETACKMPQRMSMIARDAALHVHEHHHGGSAITASQMDSKSARRVFTVRCTVNIEGCTPRHFFALAASRPPADQINCGAETARLRTSLTTVLTSSKIGSRMRSMRPDRESHCGESHYGISNTRPCVPHGGYSGTLWVLEYPF